MSLAKYLKLSDLKLSKTVFLIGSTIALSSSSFLHADYPLHLTSKTLDAGIETEQHLMAPHYYEMLKHPENLPPRKHSTVDISKIVATPGPTETVYGYWPYWGADISTIPFDSLSHLAIFGVTLNSDGSLSNTSYWTSYAKEAVELGHAYDVKIHLTLIAFEAGVMESVFSSSTKRATLIKNLKSLVDQYGADGVNVDAEGLPYSMKNYFTTFIQELNAEVEDVYIATPAIDWSGAYDFDVLAANSNGLFIMGYGYHWSGGDPGPVSPLFGGDPWSDYSLEWSVDDYVTWGTPKDKIVLGLPLYGNQWPTTNKNVPGTATGTATAVVYSNAVYKGETYGRYWDSVTHTPYTFPSSTSQLWYDDIESLEDKIAWTVDSGLQGTGFWALTYENSDPDFWAMVDSLTYTEEDPPDDEMPCWPPRGPFIFWLCRNINM